MTRKGETAVPYAVLIVLIGALCEACGPPEINPPAMDETPPESIPEPAPTTPQNILVHTALEARQIHVEIQGAVAIPGAYSFAEGARINEGIERAGGVVEGAEIRDLNIAARLIDGSVFTIPYYENYGNKAQPTAAQLNVANYTRSGGQSAARPQYGPTTPAQPSTQSTCVDLNTANQQTLETLPGVGPKTAEKIIRYREIQPFQTVEDLRNISGVGDKRLESLRPLVCVSS